MEFETISRGELVENILSYRKQLEELLVKIPPEDYLKPDFAGGWSLKDMLAHIVAWEQRMITWIRQASEGILPDVPDSDAAADRINVEIYQQNKGLALPEVLEAFEKSFPQALAVAEHAPEAVLFNENPMEGRKAPYWVTVASNTYWHYKDHIDDINRWLEAK